MKGIANVKSWYTKNYFSVSRLKWLSQQVIRHQTYALVAIFAVHIEFHQIRDKFTVFFPHYQEIRSDIRYEASITIRSLLVSHQICVFDFHRRREHQLRIFNVIVYVTHFFDSEHIALICAVVKVRIMSKLVFPVFRVYFIVISQYSKDIRRII